MTSGLPRRWRRSRRSACGSLSLLEVVWPQASTGMPRRGGGMYSVAASSGGGRSYSLWAGCTQRQKERWRAQRRECRAVSTGDRARTRRPSTPPARSPRGGTEPSHAQKARRGQQRVLLKWSSRRPRGTASRLSIRVEHAARPVNPSGSTKGHQGTGGGAGHEAPPERKEGQRGDHEALHPLHHIFQGDGD